MVILGCLVSSALLNLLVMLLPLLLAMIIYSFVSLEIMRLDVNMRGTLT